MSGKQRKGEAKTVRLKDYRPPDFQFDEVALEFDLGEETTRVRAVFSLRRNGDHERPLVLDGEGLTLADVKLDGRPLAADAYRVDDASLTVDRVPDTFELEVQTLIRPQDNTELSGLYRSSGNFCTQCEAEGFRRITYFLDRPDVLARYTTAIAADRQKYPVLLSNGNLIEQSALEDGRHRAVWQDPFPKPCYLFALVAGNLAWIEDEFVTRSGRKVALYIYTQHHNIDKCGHAMASLKKAMRWDEDAYGREYDLDRYMIVVVDDFNMGAMENKGLNIFNSKYVLAQPETATDSDYGHIEAVIAHEYFHNWSGNRVTCRDWFQLSLKEGFTVFREQQFSADMGSAGVKRIQEVNLLRTHQFREDAGPMAHPVRPQSYQEINNFYTMTVYNKGAELIRMLHRLLGAERFRLGTDRYFGVFDGQAVTTDDFVDALEQVNDIDLSQFRLWYEQAGTPVVKVEQEYHAESAQFVLTVRQCCAPTPGQHDKRPFHIPLAMALFARDGRRLPLRLGGQQLGEQAVLEVRGRYERFEFEGVSEQPVTSLLRGFSAPVRLDMERPDDDLYFLMVHDDDPFSRWEAGQQLALKLLLRLIGDYRADRPLAIDSEFVSAFRANLVSRASDRWFISETLCLPSQLYVAEFMDVVDPQAIHTVCQTIRRTLAQELAGDFLEVYRLNQDSGSYRIDAESVGKRALKNRCLGYLAELNTNETRRLAMHQFETAHNMTDSIAALAALANTECDERLIALQSFYAKWKDEPLVVDKWLGLQAMSHLPDTVAQVRMLIRHPAFHIKNPNRVRALIGAFAQANPVRFHESDGSGYALVGDMIEQLDRLNPQVAARLMTAFNLWRRYDTPRQALMKAQIERMLAVKGLSKDVEEIATKSLE